MATGTPATRVARQAKLDFTLHEYVHDEQAEYGIEAAQQLGVDGARVFKTLVARTADDRHVVAVVPVTAHLDLKALAAAVHAKHAEMARPADAQRLTGYVIGGISPLGQKRKLPTVIDAAAREYATVFVSGGRRGLEIELAPDDLVRMTDATIAEIARS
jgi:Cys-tRNA(Pro)/Cys-tRNA(Cys) deacylase